ncbi:hypothetical protein SeGA_6142, partial [Salmonella enterica subsp. enterica serovar Gaminara str. A4-567]
MRCIFIARFSRASAAARISPCSFCHASSSSPVLNAGRNMRRHHFL